MAVVVVWQDPITGKNGFTALSTDTLPNAAAGSQAWITDQPGTIKQYDGTAWVQTHSGGAALVSVASSGPQTAGVTREHATLTTTVETSSFTEAENVTRIRVDLFLTAAATSATDVNQLLADAWICFDAPSAAVAALWLTQADHLTDDSLRFRVGMNEPLEVNFPAGYVGNYYIKAGHLATGQTIGATVSTN